MTAGRPTGHDERGVVAPSRVMLVAIVGIAIAAATYIATTPHPEVSARTVPVDSTPSASPTPTPSPTKIAPVKKKAAVKRGDVIVEVFNNSGVSGLASRTSGKARSAGWDVVGSDNWYGTIPATTVYYPPRLKAAAVVLARDLGIQRLKPAIDPMRFDRLTVILTRDYS
jgi:hypothetical protein